MATGTEFLTVAQTLCRAKAMTTATGTYVGDWINIQSARDLDFFIRMTSAGAPNLAVSVDLSPFPVFLADKNAVPPSSAVQPAPPYNPDSNYFTQSINATFQKVWDGSSPEGGWSELGPVSNIASHYSSLRYRIVVTGANATAVDFVMTRAAR